MCFSTVIHIRKHVYREVFLTPCFFVALPASLAFLYFGAPFFPLPYIGDISLSSSFLSSLNKPVKRLSMGGDLNMTFCRKHERLAARAH